MARRTLLVGMLFLSLTFTAVFAAQTPTTSIDDPVPMGTAAPVGDYTVRVVEYDADATDELVAQNENNVPPEDGYVYALITFEVGYEGAEIGQASTLSWQFVGARRSALTDTSCTGGDRTLAAGTLDNAGRDADIFPGGSVEFEQCVYLSADDAQNVTMYVVTPEDERVFFELAEDADAEAAEATPDVG
jgi:hypothetical protein